MDIIIGFAAGFATSHYFGDRIIATVNGWLNRG
jgi:hypothetical protein